MGPGLTHRSFHPSLLRYQGNAPCTHVPSFLLKNGEKAQGKPVPGKMPVLLPHGHSTPHQGQDTPGKGLWTEVCGEPRGAQGHQTASTWQCEHYSELQGLSEAITGHHHLFTASLEYFTVDV